MKVVKRNGEEADFSRSKIVQSIVQANSELAESRPKEALHEETINAISMRIYERCRKRSWPTTTTEIQSMVETELMKAGAFELAKIYIKYGLRKAGDKIES